METKGGWEYYDERVRGTAAAKSPDALFANQKLGWIRWGLACVGGAAAPGPPSSAGLVAPFVRTLSCISSPLSASPSPPFPPHHSTTPGSSALLQLDTTSEVVQAPEERGVDVAAGAPAAAVAPPENELVLGYLKSYERMGQASVECVANCK